MLEEHDRQIGPTFAEPLGGRALLGSEPEQVARVRRAIASPGQLTGAPRDREVAS
jgi:hypothetical protein